MRRHQPKYSAGSQCVGKQRYPSRDSAVIGAAKVNRSGAIGVESYRCPHCSYWHVGHPTGTVLKARFQK